MLAQDSDLAHLFEMNETSDKKLPLLQKFDNSFANSEIFCPDCVCATITVPETIQSQMRFIQIASPVYFPERKVTL